MMCAFILVPRMKVAPFVSDVVLVPVLGSVPAVRQRTIDVKERSSLLRFKNCADEPTHQRSAPGKGDLGKAAALQVVDRRFTNPSEIGRVRVGIPRKGLPMYSEGTCFGLQALNQGAPIGRIECRSSAPPARVVCPTVPLQPRRLRRAPAAVGCKRLLDRVAQMV